MKILNLILAVGAAGFGGISHAATPYREIVLANKASGVPYDPLPPLRENHPSAEEMTATPKQHPYLFFTRNSREKLRARRAEEPFRSFYKRILAQADECAARDVPPQAVFNPDNLPMHLPDGSYSPEYAKLEYANPFFLQSYTMREVIPTLGLAFQLTGDVRYAEAGKKWLLSYARRNKFTPTGREADFHMAQVMYSMALGYDWLYEVLDEGERAEVRGRLAALSGPMYAAGKKILARSAEALERGERSALGGNHYVRTNGMYALTPLVLLYEVPEAAQWLDAEIQVQRDRLYPSAYAPDGEYQDAWDHYKSSMDDPIAFAVALRRMGGEDFFNDATLGPRFRGMPHYFLYGLETRTLDQPWNAHGWSGRDRATNIYSWLALAGALKDPVAQWIATRDNGLAKLDPLLGYLFYDPDVPATPPTDPAGSVYFPYSGLVKLCSDWSAEGILIPFRCGPRMAVDQGDQNGFRLRAGGDWLVPRLNQVDRLPEQTDLFNYDLMGWFWGSAAQNVVVADPDHIADYQTYRKTGGIPVGGGVQWSTYTEFKYNMAPTNERRPQPSYDKHQEWLLESSTPKTGDLRVVIFDPALDYICGENHRSYFFSQPTLALRHVLFVKAGAGSPSAPYVLICDEIDFADQPHTLAWQLHAGASLMTKGNRMEIDGPHASLAVHWLLPADGRLVTKQTPAPLEKERTEFVQYQTAAPIRQGVYVTVLLPRKNGTAEAEPEMKIIPAEGGWAVEVHGAEGTDVALFRAAAADAVSAAGVTTQGTAALLRRPDRGQTVLYTLGK